MSLPPDFNPDALTLREATPEERITCWRNNSEAWRGRLSVEEYIGQQEVNGNQELTRNGGIRYWVFTDEAEIYASAETLRKPVAVRSGDGGSHTEQSYGVAGVFTPARYRRRGIASAMMRRLAAWLDGEQAHCRFTALWSAVGGFYERFGWAVYPTQEAIIPAGSAAGDASSVRHASLLARDTLRALVEGDTAAVESEIQSAPLPTGKHARVAFLPTNAQASWYFSSEEYVASKLWDPPRRGPVNKGASASSGPVWCYWLHDFNADKLTLLRLVLPRGAGPAGSKAADTAAQVTEVLQAARAEARSWGAD